LVEAACTEVLASPTRLPAAASMGPLEAASNSHLEASTSMLENPTLLDRHWSRFVKEPQLQHSAQLLQDVQKLSSSSASVPKNPVDKRCALHRSLLAGDFQSLQNVRGPC
jgi:chemotaxis regulatin CheY-phosphate phosphatase CheZ